MFGFFKKHKEEYSPEVQAVRDKAASEMKAEKCGFVCKTKKLGNAAGRAISEKEARLRQEASRRKVQLEQATARRKAQAEQKYEAKMRQKVEAERRKREKIAKKLALKEMARRERCAKLERQKALKDELRLEREERKQLESVAAKKRNADLARRGKIVAYKGALAVAVTGQKAKPVARTAGKVAKKAGRVTVKVGKAGVTTVRRYGPGMVRDTLKAGKVAADGVEMWADAVIAEKHFKTKAQPRASKATKRKSTKGKKRRTSTQSRYPVYSFSTEYAKRTKPRKAPAKRKAAARKRQTNDFW